MSSSKLNHYLVFIFVAFCAFIKLVQAYTITQGSCDFGKTNSPLAWCYETNDSAPEELVTNYGIIKHPRGDNGYFELDANGAVKGFTIRKNVHRKGQTAREIILFSKRRDNRAQFTIYLDPPILPEQLMAGTCQAKTPFTSNSGCKDIIIPLE